MKNWNQPKELRILSNELRSNVDPTRGVTNELVYSFCRRVCDTNGPFRGVYSLDKIPKSYCNRAGITNIIVNLARSDLQIDGHFVFIHIRPDYVLYIDPTGSLDLPIMMVNFLRNCNRDVMYNQNEIQNKKSVFCALYAILYAMYYDRKTVPFKIEFDCEGCKSNDTKCVNYIRRLIKIRKK